MTTSCGGGALARPRRVVAIALDSGWGWWLTIRGMTIRVDAGEAARPAPNHHSCYQVSAAESLVYVLVYVLEGSPDAWAAVVGVGDVPGTRALADQLGADAEEGGEHGPSNLTPPPGPVQRSTPEPAAPATSWRECPTAVQIVRERQRGIPASGCLGLGEGCAAAWRRMARPVPAVVEALRSLIRIVSEIGSPLPDVLLDAMIRGAQAVDAADAEARSAASPPGCGACLQLRLAVRPYWTWTCGIAPGGEHPPGCPCCQPDEARGL